MQRDLSQLGDRTFDLLVVGAGIYGACAAWDATLRGLSVAVIDQGDFGAATSANSLRIVHGGLRYLARGDLPRMRESIRERSTLLRIAPGLVEPLPMLIPIYGGFGSRWAHRLGLALNDLASSRRNRELNRGRLIPRGRVISRKECLCLFPNFVSAGLGGGALWYDAQLRHPERLTFSFVQAAAERGAAAVNYVRAERLRTQGGVACGAWITDRLTGTELEVTARTVLVAAGPWTNELVTASSRAAFTGDKGPRGALGLNLVLKRRLAEVAVGVRATSGRRGDPAGGGPRYLFHAPQGEATLLGTWYTLADDTDTETARNRGVDSLLQELNGACRGLELGPADVVRLHWGWLPLRAGHEPGAPNALAERPRVLDHGSTHGLRHLISVEGVKYTTARRVAERAVDAVFRSLGQSSPPCRTAEVRLPGAQVGVPLQPGSEVGRREILRAVRDEMAVKLTDVVFRRTDIGAAPGPGRRAVEEVARVAGAELGWDNQRQEVEIETVMREAGLPGPSMEAVG